MIFENCPKSCTPSRTIKTERLDRLEKTDIQTEKTNIHTEKTDTQTDKTNTQTEKTNIQTDKQTINKYLEVRICASLYTISALALQTIHLVDLQVG